MIEIISGLPANIAGFVARVEVTKDDYTQVVVPKIDEAARHDKLCFFLVLKTDVGNFDFGAWVQDISMGLKHWSKWHKMAIVTDQKFVEKISDIVSPVMPAEVRGFSLAEEQQAREWITTD